MPRKTLEWSVVECLTRYPWPGNVRELRNQIERAVIMSREKVIRVRDLSAEVREGRPTVGGREADPGPPSEDAARDAAAPPAQPVRDADESTPTISPGPPGEILPLQEARRRFERDMIRRALERNNWNVSRAADELGLERTNLHKKLRVYGLTKGERE